MAIRIGTEFMGKVDAVGTESIQTKFLVIGGPIAPLESWYVLQDTFRGVNGFRIPLHGKSVLLGYLRNWLYLPAIVLWVLAFAVAEEMIWMVFPAVLLTAAWLVCWLALGRTPAEEKRQRELLRTIAGVAALPRMLPPDAVTRFRTQIAAAAAAHGLADDRSAVGTASAPALLPLAWALAVYSGWDDVAARHWSVLAGLPATASVPSTAPDATGGAITPR